LYRVVIKFGISFRTEGGREFFCLPAEAPREGGPQRLKEHEEMQKVFLVRIPITSFMKKYFYAIMVLMLSSGSLFAQCFCARIRFQLIVDSSINQNNYFLKPIKFPTVGNYDTTARKFIKEEINDDTLQFLFHTGGGIDTLTFAVVNLTDKTEMIVTVRHMTYDNPYFIDLTKFTPGHFIFDWEKISKCQNENLSTRLIECEGMKLYQLRLKSKTEHFAHNEIRPYDLRLFEASD
jgi:hypothetical protein